MPCKLKKVIYGLKENPQDWFVKFYVVVIGISFQLCYYDHSSLSDELPLVLLFLRMTFD